MAVVSANNNSLSAITALPASITGGALTLISTQTASSSSTISFTSGIDSTYKEYIFKIINAHPSSNNQRLAVNFSVDSGSNYNVTKTTTVFRASNKEDNSEGVLGYITSNDLAQSTDFQNLIIGAVGTDNDSAGSGTLHLFDPSNTTFVKHFMFNSGNMQENDTACNSFVAGYGNTTSAINAVQFKFVSGNIDSGTFKLYGVS